jgi:hypothetical protein
MSVNLPTSLGAATDILMVGALSMTLWLGVLSLVANFGGWSTVARDYPADEQPGAGERTTVSTLSFGRGWVSLGSYRYAVTLILSPRGFELWTKLPFQFQHPGISVPWGDVRAYEKGRFLGQPFIQIMLSQGQYLRIRGRAATALTRALADAAARSRNS